MKKRTFFEHLIITVIVTIMVSTTAWGQSTFRQTSDYMRKTVEGLNLTNHTSNTSNPHAVTKAQVGLTNASDTADADKPVSTAQQNALNLKANITNATLVTPNIGVATGTSLTLSGAVQSNSSDATTMRLYNANGFYVQPTVDPTQAANITPYYPPAAPTADGQIQKHNIDGTSYFANETSGDSVAGNDTQIQYNNNGSMGAHALFRYDYTNGTVNLGNSTSGRGGISFGDNNTSSSFKTGYTGADDATENYLMVTPNAKPGAGTKSIVMYTPNGNMTGGNNETYAKVDGSWLDITAFSNTTPGNSKYWGTNSTGAQGYHDLPSGTNASYANISETNTGTETAKSVTPDGLAGSNFGARVMSFTTAYLNNTTTGMVGNPISIPSIFNGWNIVSAGVRVWTNSTNGTPTYCIYRNRGGAIVEVTSTNITIDANESDSSTAATASVINTSNDDLQTGDLIYVNNTVTGTGTQGSNARVTIQMP